MNIGAQPGSVVTGLLRYRYLLQVQPRGRPVRQLRKGLVTKPVVLGGWRARRLLQWAQRNSLDVRHHV